MGGPGAARVVPVPVPVLDGGSAAASEARSRPRRQTTTEIAAKRLLRSELRGEEHPRSGQWCERLLVSQNNPARQLIDLGVVFALMYVAIVTPYEVSFLADQPDNEALGAVGRVIDVLFIADMLLNFVTPFQLENGVWVTDHRSIAWRYMTSWFLVDLISVMPLEYLRMIRLVRLIKLLRLVRMSRVLKRFEAHLSIPYGIITLAKYFIMMITISHWLACLIRIVVVYEFPDGWWVEKNDPEWPAHSNWIRGYFMVQLNYADHESVTPWLQYNAAIYWAVMTVTTIGYGDVVPKTFYERWVTVFGMMVGGAAYAYVVGSVCGVVASMSEVTKELHGKIDLLNGFMNQHGVPHDLRVQLREYFQYTIKKSQDENYRELLDQMSPQMRARMYTLVNMRWVECIPFSRCCTDFERDAFVTVLSEQLKGVIVPPRERICRAGEISHALYVIQRGVAVMFKTGFIPQELSDNPNHTPTVSMRATLEGATTVVLARDECFGADMVLTDARRRCSVMSFTFVELQMLTKEALDGIFASADLRETHRNFRRYVVRLAFRLRCMDALRRLRPPQRSTRAAPKSPKSKPKSPKSKLKSFLDEGPAQPTQPTQPQLPQLQPWEWSAPAATPGYYTEPQDTAKAEAEARAARKAARRAHRRARQEGAASPGDSPTYSP